MSLSQNNRQPASPFDRHAALHRANRNGVGTSSNPAPHTDNYPSQAGGKPVSHSTTKAPKPASKGQILKAHPHPNARTSTPPQFGGVGKHASETIGSLRDKKPQLGGSAGNSVGTVTPDSAPQVVKTDVRAISGSQLSKNMRAGKGIVGN